MVKFPIKNGFWVLLGAQLCACDAIRNGFGCDDCDTLLVPNDKEYCDGVDNDGDALVDEDDALDAATWYLDADGDGFGTDEEPLQACSQPWGYTGQGGDCDDATPGTHPGASEICDEIDQDCDGEADEDAEDAGSWYTDDDGDGWGGELVSACEQPSATVGPGWTGDCDDGDASTYPGAEEVPDDGVDQDCDGEDGQDAFAGVYMGNLTLESHAAMAEFCAEHSVIWGSLSVHGFGVTALTELSCLEEVHGGLTIYDTALLVIELPALETVDGSLYLSDNTDLADITSLHGVLNVADNLTITDNAMLTDADAQALVDAIGSENIGGDVTIEGNGE